LRRNIVYWKNERTHLQDSAKKMIVDQDLLDRIIKKLNAHDEASHAMEKHFEQLSRQLQDGVKVCHTRCPQDVCHILCFPTVPLAVVVLFVPQQNCADPQTLF
jgi:hypothetical protein